MKIDWLKEVHKRKLDLLNDTKQLLQIKSVLDEKNAAPEAPLGPGVKRALSFMLELGKQDGFTVKNVDHLAGHIEFGEGEELVGILCHVDVVPEGDGWSVDPYKAVIQDGKLIARGALDDKGPTMAAYYAMKIVKELDLPLQKRVRIIIGTDEESEWRCVEHYFKKEEMPTIGFAPDADFPIIYAEKGIADLEIRQQPLKKAPLNGLIVHSFSAGRRKNMVPDMATAVLTISDHQMEEVIERFVTFAKDNQLPHQHDVTEGQLILKVKGISAHGMEPENGKNAGIYLADFLTSLHVDEQAAHFLSFVTNYFKDDSRGRKLGVAYADEITGELTVNVGEITYHHKSGGYLGLSVRYPVTNQTTKMRDTLIKVLEKERMELTQFSNSKPHYVDKDNELVRTLQTVYEEQTGEKAELLSIGGGTYARSLTSGVAFGPLFPGRPDIAHQKDEYMYIEDLLKAAAIYAQAIYELARKPSSST